MLASLLTGALILAQSAMPASSAPDVYVTNTLDSTVAVVNGNSVQTTIPVMDLRGVGTSPKETALSPNGSTLYTLSHANVPGKRFWITEINTRTAKYTGRAPVDFTPYQFVVTPDGKQAFVRNHARITAVNLHTGKPTYLRNLFPIDETLSPDGGTLYVAEDNGDLLVVTTATDAITTTLHNSNQNEAVAVSPDGKSVYVLSFSQVQVIDAATNTVTATIPLPQTSVHGGRYQQHLAVTPDGQRLFAYTAGAPTYSVVDLANNTVLNTFTPLRGLRTLAFAPHGSLAYGTGSGIGYTIDATTGAIDSTNTTAFTGGTHSIALTSDDTKAMVTEEPTNTVTEIDMATNTAAAKIEVGLEPYGVSLGPSGHAFVANEVSSTVSVVDVATATVINTVGSEFIAPTAIAVSPDGKTAYVGGSFGSSLRVIDTRTNSTDGVINGVGPRPDAITFSPDGSRAYVSAVVFSSPDYHGSVTVVDTATRTPIAMIRLDSPPGGLVVGPGRAYVANTETGVVSVIDTSTNTFTGTIKVDAQPSAPVLSPDGSTLYVHTSNGIDVVNTATGTVTGTINAGTPIGVTPNETTLYAAGSGQVQAISTATHAVTATIAVAAGQPADAVLSSDGTHVYVLNDQFEPTAQAVTTIDTATNTVTGTTTLGPGQWSNLATR